MADDVRRRMHLRELQRRRTAQIDRWLQAAIVLLLVGLSFFAAGGGF